MTSFGEASAPNLEMAHGALIYDSDEAFMEVALPFVEEGLDAGEEVLVVVSERNLENLRAALGTDPEGLELASVESWYENSARTRQKFVSWAAERAGSGRVRLIGEPPWALEDEAQIRDWARHESVINVAFAGLAVSFLCPYDSRTLPPEIVEYARSTHPEIAGPRETAVSEAYEDPHRFCKRLDGAVTRPAGTPSMMFDFGLADLPGVRRAIRAVAVDTGFSRIRADELTLAVNEIATNALVHGRAPATIRAWVGDGELIFEVSDRGDGIRDSLAGQLKPSLASLGGRGLWLTRQVCDAVEIRNGDGCAVSLHAITPAASPTA